MQVFFCSKFSVAFKLFKAHHGKVLKAPKDLADELEKDSENGYVVCRARDLLKLLAKAEGKK